MKTILSAVWNLFLSLDGIIYNLICYIFDIFYYLCGLQLFTDTDYNKIVSKIYIVLGLVMMFVLAYSLLKAVINPDEFAKGENSFPKLIKNVIVSLIIIVILPTVFNVAFSIQNSFLNYDVIPQLILGTDDGAVEGVPSINGAPGGRAIAFYTFKSFLVPNTNDDVCNGTDEEGCRNNIKANDGLGVHNGDTLSATNDLVFSGDSSFTKYANYSEAVRDDELTYYFPISTVAGIFILYVLLNFCFDMALRVVKLAFYQIIAPIPVICRVIPGGKLKDVFSKWVKQVISLFVEVFVRIAALTFGVYLIGLIVDKFEDKLPGIDSLNLVGQKTIVLALLIMSVIIFVKQIPKIIGDMFGLDTGGMKLGLMDKLAQGGALTAGAIAGGALGSLGRNAVGAVGNIKNAKGGWNKVGAAVSGLASMGAGTVSGARRGFKAGKGAKNFADMKKAAGTAVDGASAAKAKRAAYKAEHLDTRHSNAFSRFLGTNANVLTGHVSDTVQKVGGYFGINSVQDLVDENKLIDDIASKKKAVATSVDSLIDKEAGKSKSDFKVGNFTATELRRRLLAIEDAKAGNLKDAAGNTISVAQAQQMYDQYRYDFSQAAQNVAFLSNEHFENLANSADKDVRDVYVKLAGAHASAEGMREAITRNLDKQFVQDAGFTKEYVQGDMRVDLSGKPLKGMGDVFDVAKARNEGEIARKQRESQSKDGK